MDLLKNRILKDGKALSSEILKVDSFLNHQVDPELMKEIGIEFAKYFKDKYILYTKQQFLNEGLLGKGEQHKRINDYLGDYI